MQRVLRLLLAVESHSEHPLGRAVVDHARRALRAVATPPPGAASASVSGALSDAVARKLQQLPGMRQTGAYVTSEGVGVSPGAALNSSMRGVGGGGEGGGGEGEVQDADTEVLRGASATDFTAVPGRGLSCRYVRNHMCVASGCGDEVVFAGGECGVLRSCWGGLQCIRMYARMLRPGVPPKTVSCACDVSRMHGCIIAWTRAPPLSWARAHSCHRPATALVSSAATPGLQPRNRCLIPHTPLRAAM
jgi:hypothetical protein